MAELPYVCLYTSYLDTLAPYTDAERGRIMFAMLSYAATGTKPEFSENERFIWPTIQAQIDRDVATYQGKCEQNRTNGAKGGRPSKNQTVMQETERFFEKPKKPKEKEKEKEKDNIGDGADKPPARHRFTPPTVDEVRTYCAEQGYSVDPERFVDFYTSNGWMVGKNHMKDWQAAVRSWQRKEEPNGKTESIHHDWRIGTVV